MKQMLIGVLCVAAFAAAGCGKEERPAELVFWHTQAQRNGKLLQQICDDYNATGPPMKVSARYIGGYGALFRKVRATIPTGELPDLVVAYESMVAEYIESEAVVALDDYIADPEIGLSKESLDDIFPSILANNRYPAYGDKYYTFPFTKSILMLYYNADLLKQAGFDAPPKTWPEFSKQCLAAKKLGKKGYALSVDASTVDAFVMSFGGEILSPDRKRALFAEPAGVAALTLVNDLVKSGAAYQIDRESYGDRKDFSSGRCAFMIRSSTTRPYIEHDIQGKFNWDLAVIPHSEAVAKPVTVLFGANIAVMKTTPERQRAAWQFVRYFCSKAVTAKWSTGTGYLPVRKSAAETEEVRAFFEKTPRNRRAFDTLPFARPEPGVFGWQAVRDAIEEAESKAIGGRTPPAQLAKELTERANEVLGESDR